VRPVNLIPQERRRRTTSGRSGSAYVVLGVLGVLLAMAVAYVLTTNTLNERTTEAAEARQEADALEARASKMNSFTDFASLATTRLASVRGVAASRFDWERFVRELSHVMPRGSWLHTTDASVTGAIEGATPTATSTTSTAGVGAPTAKLIGCTPRQDDVARMMVRLRLMHRVTDVTLNESAVEQIGGETSLDQCGDLYKFDLTVTFDPTAPVDEAPGGQTRVPASLGGGS
jgi:Tfp pilus assembly protein PilN